MSSHAAELDTIETRIPARLDRLPWARFHWLIVIGLGTVWIVGARYWGPGRFRGALVEALLEQRIRRVGRGRFDAPAH